MNKIMASLFFTFLLMGLAACSSDPYDKMPKNCVYSFGGQEIPVVCSSPVKVGDILKQPKERVESILGKGIPGQKMGLKDTKYDYVFYREGGIAVSYSEDGVSYLVNITTDQIDFKNPNEYFKKIQTFFLSDSPPEWSEGGGCEPWIEFCDSGLPIDVWYRGDEYTAFVTFSGRTCPQ